MSRTQPFSTDIRLRCDAQEKQVFEDTARLCGISLSAWIRMTLREAAEQRLAKAGRQTPWQSK